MTTLTDKERLIDLRARLLELERRAESEINLTVATGNAGPFVNACKERDECRDQIRDLERAEKGRVLQSAIETLRDLDSRLSAAQREREAAERAVSEATRDEVIQRWMKAPHVAMRYGFGHSFGMVSVNGINDNFSFRSWFLSGRERHAGLSESASWFLGPNCPGELRFNLTGDRERIRAYEQLKHNLTLALMRLGDLHERRRQLLLSHPELVSAA